MADNTTVTAGSGTTIATDEISTVHYQRVKLVDGTLDSTAAIPGDAANGLDVDVTRLPPLVAGSAVIGHVIADSGSTTVVTGTVTLAALPAGSAVIGHVIADSGSTTAVTGNVAVTLAAGATAIAKAEDVASADADVGVPAMAVRKASPANTSGTDGDWEFLQVSAGRLWASATIDAALPAGANAIGKLAANSGVTIGAVEIAAAQTLGTLSTITNVVHVDDNAGSLTVDNGGTFAVQAAVNNASGASAVNIQDGGNSITVDDANLDNATLVDNAGFTDGTTRLVMAGHIYDEVAGTALTENDAVAARVDIKRASISVIEDESTRGRRTTVTVANALKVDGSAVTQPISIAAALPTGANVIGHVIADSGSTTVVTGAVTLAALPTGSNVIGHVIADSGSTTAVTGNVATSQVAATNPAATTMQAAATANGNGTLLNVQGYGAVILNVVSSPAMSGGTTINFEASVDDTTFVPINVHQIGTTTLGTTATTDGDYRIGVAGYKSIRARISAYSAGTVTVKGYASPASLALTTTQANQAGTWTVQPGNTANTTAWKVDGSAVTQPVSGTITTTPPTNASTNVAQINGVTPLMGNGVTGTGSVRVTIASDNTAIPVAAHAVTNAGTFAVQAAITAASGALASGSIASGAVASGAVASGAFASGSIAAGAVAAGATSFVKLEDVASADADAGVPAMAVRKAAPANTSGTDGDYEMLQISAGRLWASATIDTALPAGTNVIGHVIADSGSTTAVTGNVAVTLAAGAAAIAKAEDVASADADVGVPAMAIRKATPGNTSGTDGDYEMLQMSAGRLWASTLITDGTTTAGVIVGTTALKADVSSIAGTATVTAAAGVQKVGLVGNAGATVDSTVGAGTAPTNALITGALYNNTPPAPTAGQALALQTDQAGNLRASLGIALTTLAGWTSATSVNTTQTIFGNSGAQAVLLHLVQGTTITVGAITFEVSYDNTNWVTISADAVVDPTSSMMTLISLPYTLVASTNKPFLILNKGWQGLRIKLSTAITGTGTVTPNYALLNYSPINLMNIAAGPTSVGKAEDVASADGDVGIPAMAVRKATPGNTSGTDGDWEALQISAGRLWASATIDAALPTGTNSVGNVGIVPRTSGGFTTYHLVSAATTNATNIKASAGQLFGWYIYNNNAAMRKVAFHNTAGTPTAGASILFSLPIPPNSAANVFTETGIAFSTGIAISAVTDITDAGATAVSASDLTINLWYI